MSFVRFVVVICLLLMPSLVSALDVGFYSRSDLNDDVQISPDGTYLSLQVNQDGKQGLAILKTDSMEPMNMIRFNQNRYPEAAEWVNPTRLVFRLGEMDAWFRIGHFGEWLSQEVDGTRAESIFSFRGAELQTGSHIDVRVNERAWGFFTDRLRADNDRILLTRIPFDEGGVTRLLELDVYKGTSNLSKFSPVDDPIYVIDRQARPRFVTGNAKTGELRTYYWDLVGSDAVLYASGSHESGYVSAVAFEDESKVYMTDNRQTATRAVVRVDMQSKAENKVFSDERVDPSSFFIDEETRQLYAIEYEYDRPAYHFVNEGNKAARILKGLQRAFKQHHVRIVSQSDDSNLNVVSVYSDSDPGAYYLYNYATKEARHLVDVRPWVTEMGVPRQTLTIESENGQPLPIHLTRPPAAESPELVVLLPVQPERSHWGYDPLVQMLVASGYAVLQVEFRGIAGFGKVHETTGIRDWGSVAVEDIATAVSHVRDVGRVSDRACLYGERFGAFLALKSAQNRPDIYDCAIVVGGVFDADELVDVISLPWHYDSEDYAEAMKADKTRMATLDVLKQPMTVPVLLMHGGGTIDPSLRATSSLRSQLKKQKGSRVVKLKRNKSGFYGDEARQRVYSELLKFLAR